MSTNQNPNTNQSPQQQKHERNFPDVCPETTREAYFFYKLALSLNTPAEEIPQFIAAKMIDHHNIPPQAATRLSSIAYTTFSSPGFEDSLIGSIEIATPKKDDDNKPEAATATTVTTEEEAPPPTITYTPEEIYLTSEDYRRFTESLSPDETPQIKALLLAFIVFYRRNFHPTGWIRYDKKNIFHLAGISHSSTKIQESLTSYLHSHYGLDMKVIGSNQPIPCYSFSWLQQQPPPGSTTNPMISLGPLTPSNLASVATKAVPINPPQASL